MRTVHCSYRNVSTWFFYHNFKSVLDPPEVKEEESIVFTVEGRETEIVCIVHAEPKADVSYSLKVSNRSRTVSIRVEVCARTYPSRYCRPEVVERETFAYVTSRPQPGRLGKRKTADRADEITLNNANSNGRAVTQYLPLRGIREKTLPENSWQNRVDTSVGYPTCGRCNAIIRFADESRRENTRRGGEGGGLAGGLVVVTAARKNRAHRKSGVARRWYLRVFPGSTGSPAARQPRGRRLFGPGFPSSAPANRHTFIVNLVAGNPGKRKPSRARARVSAVFVSSRPQVCRFNRTGIRTTARSLRSRARHCVAHASRNIHCHVARTFCRPNALKTTTAPGGYEKRSWCFMETCALYPLKSGRETPARPRDSRRTNWCALTTPTVLSTNEQTRRQPHALVPGRAEA